MLLSILIPTVPKRVSTFFADMVEDLERQCADRGDVEVIGFYDNRTRTLGDKRNALLDLARGKYLVFIDDDDELHTEYIPKVCAALAGNPDTEVLVYDIVLTVNSGPPKLCRYGLEFVMSNDTPTLYTAHPAHTMPWLSQLARSERFPSKSFGEDTAWSKVMSRKVTRQTRIEEVLYWYRFDRAVSETRDRKTMRKEGNFATVEAFARGTAKGRKLVPPDIGPTITDGVTEPEAVPEAQLHYLQRRAIRREMQQRAAEAQKRNRQ